VWK
jgi:hypothetical protein